MRTTQPLVRLLKPVNKILRLFLRQRTGELNDALCGRPVSEEPCRKFFQRGSQPQLFLQQINAGFTTQLTGLTQIDNVQHLIGVQDFVVNPVVDASQPVTVDRDMVWVQDDQPYNSFIVAHDPHKRVAIDKQRHKHLLEMVNAGHIKFREIQPHRAWEHRQTFTLKPAVRPDRKCADAVRNQTHTRIHRADTHSRILRDDRASLR